MTFKKRIVRHYKKGQRMGIINRKGS